MAVAVLFEQTNNKIEKKGKGKGNIKLTRINLIGYLRSLKQKQDNKLHLKVFLGIAIDFEVL